jgi:hypothetical protein
MKTFARVLLVFGLVMTVLSLLLHGSNQPGSPEETVNTMNIGLGAFMVLLAGGYLIYLRKKDNPTTGQPTSVLAKGEQNSENSKSPHHLG